MNNPLETLEPKALWQYFFQISQIPHPSGHTDKIRSFLLDFALQFGLEVKTDKAGNVLIRKAATPGFDNRKTVALQAHMDMVPQKNEGVTHVFENDPLQLRVEDGWVKATDTTLGSDNGIGVAAALAVLSSTDIQHGPIEAFFTNDEETGMFGAFGLEEGFLNSDILLNLDSEDEGELFVGCAGGIDANFTFRFTKEEMPEGDLALKVSLKGLHGGHSGVDIHLERANSNKLMVRFLKIAVSQCEARLVSFQGGSLRNAIPREASVIISVPADGVSDIFDLAAETAEMFNAEYAGVENDIRLMVEEIEGEDSVLPEVVQDDLINALYATPDGVYRHIPQMPSVVESSNNLAIVSTSEDTITVHCLVRSSAESKKYEICSTLESIFALAGAKVEFGGSYPGWQPNLDSPILKEMQSISHEKWGVLPEIKVIHAGLECGIIGAVEPDLDMISFGPTIRFPHSPAEKVEISSVQKFWDLLVATLEAVPQK